MMTDNFRIGQRWTLFEAQGVRSGRRRTCIRITSKADQEDEQEQHQKHSNNTNNIKSTATTRTTSKAQQKDAHSTQTPTKGNTIGIYKIHQHHHHYHYQTITITMTKIMTMTMTITMKKKQANDDTYNGNEGFSFRQSSQRSNFLQMSTKLQNNNNPKGEEGGD